MKSAVLDAMPRSRVIRRGPGPARRVALTFDDGPDHMTRAYLDMLGELGVSATFFLIGRQCEREPELTRAYAERGHQIASHGYDHARFPVLSVSALDDQLRRTDAAMGAQPTPRRWVRPPHGTLSARVLAQLLARGDVVALWSLDSEDYKSRDPGDLAARCAPSVVRPGEVILMHEGQEWTLEALPRVVSALRDAGYEMVTMADMFAE
jgi:peptidoglycan/xylan/chitin deacetylase (PgdA/CDA1 family)